MTPKTLCDQMAVSPQLTPEGVLDAARQGYRSIINNRPDGEEPGQPTSHEIGAAARAAGMEYVHIPIVPGQLSDEQIAAFEKALNTLPKPVLGYCKSGMRASTLWALCRCGELGAEKALQSAAEAGYDLSPLRPRLEARAG
ncbi:sulfide:quinone oxidoreductase [Altererythrobacter atlanticus]|uniref:Beta-lactamase hydrolase-like protein n=1 Tax=Croceibacterium atlanticum TaxID=1267766 RepID=A0A0F7KT87_9SPHN|nr:TIGR01244 family sulfur transferase [Croceibacterium atlanticum]AKH42814.1 Beta-lactamase hydrolase-like protein [Croceibacterium atlanticum]MBB5731594.1 sulfide:quinone oxidoreductase [Croceibacterium atlanticum]